MHVYMFDESGITYITQSDVLGDEIVEEISSLDIDLLTVLARIYQARDMIGMIDPITERIVSCDSMRLASHISDAGIQFSRDTELDTGFTTWLVEIRQKYNEALANGERL